MHSRISKHGLFQTKWSLEPGCDRASTGAPRGRRCASSLHPRCGILVRACAYDAGLGPTISMDFAKGARSCRWLKLAEALTEPDAILRRLS